MYEICANAFLKEILFVLKIFLCALISWPVCMHTA